MDALLIVAVLALVAATLLAVESIRRRRQIESVHRAIGLLEEIASGDRSELPEPDAVPRSLRPAFLAAAQRILNQRMAFEQRRHLLLEIVNGMGEGVLAIDGEKRIVLANDRLRALFGIERPQPGRPFYEVIRNATVIEAFDRGLDGETVVERTVVGTGGGERRIEVRVFPLRDSTEIAAVALLIDVTRMEKLSRIRSDFIADFSHEVRTPLAGLRSSIETLQGGRLDPEQEHQLERIVQRQLGRLERLVADLAELNTIESGDLVLHREPTEIRELLTDLAHDFFENIEDRRIAIVVEGDRSTADVDPIRIEQVFSNLVDNAIKHAPGSDEVRIDVIDRETETEVRVTDRGPGIPKAEREKVFHRFYMVDKSRSGENAGTGLGLAITKHLVLQHGGEVDVESEPGHGSTFIVRLPKVRPEPS